MKNLLLFLSFVVFTTVSCQKDSEPSKTMKEPVAVKLSEKGKMVVANSNRFGIDLFRKVAADEENNFMLSPLSASIALTMLLNGCNGDTYEQVHQMLGYGNLTQGEINQSYKSLVNQLLAADNAVEFSLANAVWYRLDFSVKTPFLDTMNANFEAHIQGLDFNTPEALDVINGWANEKTHHKIPVVLNEISSEAVMFLMNALYFKGSWTYRFDENQTFGQPFYITPDNPVIVPAMHGRLGVKICHKTGYSVMELPYGRQNFSMLFFLPSGNIDDLIAGINIDDWQAVTASLDSMTLSTEIEVAIPKFRFAYEKMLNTALNALGMTDAFIPFTANLSGISDASIFVSFVKQNTFIDVNEEGTEAAAVTTIGIELTSMPDAFYVNKPFVFAIREKTSNTILFIGKVVMPQYD